MLDAYYGYDDNGLVRTNLAGGVNREKLEKERAQDAVRELDRARRAHRRRRHVGQEAGRVLLPRLLRARRGAGERDLPEHRRLPRPQPHRRRDPRRRGLRPAEGPQGTRSSTPGLSHRVWTTEPEAVRVAVAVRHGRPRRRTQTENPRRLIVMSEKHAGEQPVAARHLRASRRRRRSRSRRSRDFNCQPNRGGTDKSFFIVNHWLRPERPARPGRGSQGQLEEGAHGATAAVHRATAPDPERARGRLHRDRRPLPDRQPVQRGHRAPVRRHRDGVEGGEPAPQPGGHHRRRGHRAERAPPPPGDLGDVARVRCSARSRTPSPHRARCRSSPARARPAPGRPPTPSWPPPSAPPKRAAQRAKDSPTTTTPAPHQGCVPD